MPPPSPGAAPDESGRSDGLRPQAYGLRPWGDRALLAWDLGLLLALIVLLLFAGLGATALTDRDEGANAGAAREMLEQESWITPTLDYAVRFAKPALVYWLMAVAYRSLGVAELGARLPSALATAALVLAQYAFTRWALGRATALRAALILLLSVEVVTLGRMALTDATLMLWTTLAGFAFFRAHHGPPPRARWYAGLYAALALAMLTKGPVGVIVPLAGIVTYLALAGGWRRAVRESHPGWGLLVFLAVAGPWYGAMFWRHGVEYAARARGETLGRVFRAVTGPGGTALFYVPVLLLGFFPWSAFLPGALIQSLRGARRRAAGDRRGAVMVFAAAWVVAGLVFFSLLQSRLPHYVGPLFPVAALLVGAGWPDTPPRLARWLLGTLGALVGATALAAGVMGATLTRLLAPVYPADPAARLPGAVFGVAALAFLIGGAAVLKDGAALFRLLALATAGLLALALHGVLPGFDTEFVAPAGSLAWRAAASAAPCDDLVAFGPYRPSLVFYARRPMTFVDVPDRSRLAELAARPGRLFLLTPRALHPTLPAALAALPVVDARGGYLLLVSERAEPACP